MRYLRKWRNHEKSFGVGALRVWMVIYRKWRFGANFLVLFPKNLVNLPLPAYLCGAVAQLGERRVRNAEARGSIPLCSTNTQNNTLQGWRFVYCR